MPARVFVSYAHEDEKLKDELLKHLRVLQRQGVIETWHDRLIAAGTTFDGEIREQLESSALVLLLVSPDFLASDYCWTEEMTRALELERALPVILRPCAWQDAPFAHLTAAPTDGKPVTSWKNRDEAFFDVVKHIKRAVAGAPSASAPSITNLPPRNPNFTGRKDLLARLHSALMKDRKAAVVQALAGLGGVGKTQLAIEYAHAHADEYPIIWWMRSEQPTTLAADYAALAEPLQLRERGSADQSAIVRAVKHHLERAGECLLIFDNVEKPEDVAPYLPTRGDAIVTSRNPSWRGIAQPLDVNVMDRQDAIDFLLARSGADDRSAADRLTDALGDLPLALEQAAAYVEKAGVSLADYLELFATRRKELWKANAADEMQTIAATWNLALEKVAVADPAAVDLLTLYAFLDPDDIPRQLLQWINLNDVPEALHQLATDPLRMNEAVARLRQYSLITATSESVSLHRLIQFVLRDRLVPEKEIEAARTAFQIVRSATPQSAHQVALWSKFAALLPHVRRIIDIAIELGINGDSNVLVAGLCTARYLGWRADFRGALNLLRTLERLTDDELWFAAIRADMAPAIGNLGDREAAYTLLRDIIESRRAEFGEAHPQMARHLRDLGAMLIDLGRYDEAIDTLTESEKVFRSCEEFGSQSIHAIVKSTLGTALAYKGQHEPACIAMEEALAIHEKLEGPDSASQVVVRHNLGMTLAEMGQHERAEAEWTRAFDLARRTFGDDHLWTCRCRFTIANYSSLFGDVEAAAVHIDKAVAAFVATFGSRNEEAARKIDLFATKALKAGRPDIAEKYRKIAEDLRP